MERQESVEVAIVDSWDLLYAEGSGGDEKAWLRDPDRCEWLFKPRTEHDGWAQGEDWAEKITSELAALLGVPAARAELALRNGRHGSLSLSLRPNGWELQHGSLLLSDVIPGYEPHRTDRRGHSLINIERALDSVQAPLELPELTAFEAFTGFLLLDALVANQDRHDENWGVLRPLPGQGHLTLAGSYDHGSALGFNLTDRKRELELGRGGVPAFSARAKAQRFDRSSDGMLSLAELAAHALDRCSAGARGHWRGALSAVDEAELAHTVGLVPDLSDSVRRFTVELLVTNRRRLLHDR